MSAPQQLKMFEVPVEPELAFNVYHDESGSYTPRAGDRWLLHGILIVPEWKQKEVFTALQGVRQETGYSQEVHYADLRRHLSGPKSRCTKGWLDLYVKRFSENCFFYCLAIDTRSPRFDHKRFGESHHAYNRFARMAIEGAIAWSLNAYHRVALKFYSDDKFRLDGDNFADYIPKEIRKSIAEKSLKRDSSYPEIRLLHSEVIPVDSDPHKANPNLREECEFIQLIDLMTSSVYQALTARSVQLAKIDLAEKVASWIEDTCKPPWLQKEDLYRRFTVSCYPDKKGNFYNPSLALSDKNQLVLFEIEERENP